MATTVTAALIDALGEESPGVSAWQRPGSHYLLPLGNVSLICHVVRELADGGIERVRIVTQAGDRAVLEQALGRGEAWGVQLSYAEARADDRDLALLLELEEMIADDPVLVHPGDCLFPGQVLPLREGFGRDEVDFVLLGKVTTRPSGGWERGLDVAVVIGAGAAPLIAESAHAAAGEHRLIDSLLAADASFKLCELGVHWCYSDSIDALLRGNQIVLDGLPSTPTGGQLSSAGNQVTGRLAIHPSAHIANSTIHGPAAIDADAVVEDSFIGPYTAIGTGAVVAGAEIDNTIVHAEARVEHPGQRIEASLIGERATVGRTFDLPKGLHLRLGPDSRVIFS